MSKVVVLTGAAGGLGTQIAREALNAAHQVVTSARNPERTMQQLGDHENLLAI